jgi:flavin reductase (DIM6/NTAB) family NADH-FMN oxidoreductase RutF
MTSSQKSEISKSSLEELDLRRALGSFVTGVTVVTTNHNGKNLGFTANSFTSVSLDPPLVLVCLGRSSSNAQAFSEVEHFAVNILAEQQRDVSRMFASKGIDRFAEVSWTAGELGDPIIHDVAAWFECTLRERVDGGDHIILIGHVKSYGHETVRPLGYCRGAYVMFQLDQDIMASRSSKTRVGTILETTDGIVLIEDRLDGTYKLPCSHKLGSTEAKEGLVSALQALAIDFELDFLFSVYEDENADVLNVYYRGTAELTSAAANIKVFSLDTIPWDRLENDPQRALLRRYVAERQDSRFSIYVGNSSTGRYKTIESS